MEDDVILAMYVRWLFHNSLCTKGSREYAIMLEKMIRKVCTPSEGIVLNMRYDTLFFIASGCIVFYRC